jgi:hypothetical protein
MKVETLKIVASKRDNFFWKGIVIVISNINLSSAWLFPINLFFI